MKYNSCYGMVERRMPKLFAILFCGCFTFLCTNTGYSAIVSFDNPWIGSGFVNYKQYYEADFSLRLNYPSGDENTKLRRVGTPALYTSDNGTPHMEYYRDYPVLDYADFSMSNSAPFGVVSVDLAEPYPDVHTSSTVTFIGVKLDGSSVTNSFTLDGISDGFGGQPDFQTFSFDTSFSSGLTWVDIPTSNWAMDNLVVVPEPGTVTIFIVGLGTCAGWFWRKRRR